MSNELIQYRYDTLASLYWIPCTIKELNQRDFCSHLPEWYLFDILNCLKRDGLVIERKDGVWKVVKGKTGIELKKRGYEIDD